MERFELSCTNTEVFETSVSADSTTSANNPPDRSRTDTLNCAAEFKSAVSASFTTGGILLITKFFYLI